MVLQTLADLDTMPSSQPLAVANLPPLAVAAASEAASTTKECINGTASVSTAKGDEASAAVPEVASPSEFHLPVALVLPAAATESAEAQSATDKTAQQGNLNVEAAPSFPVMMQEDTAPEAVVTDTSGSTEVLSATGLPVQIEPVAATVDGASAAVPDGQLPVVPQEEGAPPADTEQPSSASQTDAAAERVQDTAPPSEQLPSPAASAPDEPAADETLPADDVEARAEDAPVALLTDASDAQVAAELPPSPTGSEVVSYADGGPSISVAPTPPPAAESPVAVVAAEPDRDAPAPAAAHLAPTAPSPFMVLVGGFSTPLRATPLPLPAMSPPAFPTASPPATATAVPAPVPAPLPAAVASGGAPPRGGTRSRLAQRRASTGLQSLSGRASESSLDAPTSKVAASLLNSPLRSPVAGARAMSKTGHAAAAGTTTGGGDRRPAAHGAPRHVHGARALSVDSSGGRSPPGRAALLQAAAPPVSARERERGWDSSFVRAALLTPDRAEETRRLNGGRPTAAGSGGVSPKRGSAAGVTHLAGAAAALLHSPLAGPFSVRSRASSLANLSDAGAGTRPDFLLPTNSGKIVEHLPLAAVAAGTVDRSALAQLHAHARGAGASASTLTAGASVILGSGGSLYDGGGGVHAGAGMTSSGGTTSIADISTLSYHEALAALAARDPALYRQVVGTDAPPLPPQAAAAKARGGAVIINSSRVAITSRRRNGSVADEQPAGVGKAALAPAAHGVLQSLLPVVPHAGAYSSGAGAGERATVVTTTTGGRTRAGSKGRRGKAGHQQHRGSVTAAAAASAPGLYGGVGAPLQLHLPSGTASTLSQLPTGPGHVPTHLHSTAAGSSMSWGAGGSTAGLYRDLIAAGGAPAPLAPLASSAASTDDPAFSAGAAYGRRSSLGQSIFNGPLPLTYGALTSPGVGTPGAHLFGSLSTPMSVGSGAPHQLFAGGHVGINTADIAARALAAAERAFREILAAKGLSMGAPSAVTPGVGPSDAAPAAASLAYAGQAPGEGAVPVHVGILEPDAVAPERADTARSLQRPRTRGGLELVPVADGEVATEPALNVQVVPAPPGTADRAARRRVPLQLPGEFSVSPYLQPIRVMSPQSRGAAAAGAGLNRTVGTASGWGPGGAARGRRSSMADAASGRRAASQLQGAISGASRRASTGGALLVVASGSSEQHQQQHADLLAQSALASLALGVASAAALSAGARPGSAGGFRAGDAAHQPTPTPPSARTPRNQQQQMLSPAAAASLLGLGRASNTMGSFRLRSLLHSSGGRHPAPASVSGTHHGGSRALSASGPTSAAFSSASSDGSHMAAVAYERAKAALLDRIADSKRRTAGASSGRGGAGLPSPLLSLVLTSPYARPGSARPSSARPTSRGASGRAGSASQHRRASAVAEAVLTSPAGEVQVQFAGADSGVGRYLAATAEAVQAATGRHHTGTGGPVDSDSDAYSAAEAYISAALAAERATLQAVREQEQQCEAAYMEATPVPSTERDSTSDAAAAEVRTALGLPPVGTALTDSDVDDASTVLSADPDLEELAAREPPASDAAPADSQHWTVRLRGSIFASSLARAGVPESDTDLHALTRHRLQRFVSKHCPTVTPDAVDAAASLPGIGPGASLVWETLLATSQLPHKARAYRSDIDEALAVRAGVRSQCAEAADTAAADVHAWVPSWDGESCLPGPVISALLSALPSPAGFSYGPGPEPADPTVAHALSADSRPPPSDDSDLGPWHLGSMLAVCLAHAPSQVPALQGAWAKFSAQPDRIWGALHKQAPEAVTQAAAVLQAVVDARAAARSASGISTSDGAVATGSSSGSVYPVTAVPEEIVEHFLMQAQAQAAATAAQTTEGGDGAAPPVEESEADPFPGLLAFMTQSLAGVPPRVLAQGLSHSLGYRVDFADAALAPVEPVAATPHAEEAAAPAASADAPAPVPTIEDAYDAPCNEREQDGGADSGSLPTTADLSASHPPIALRQEEIATLLALLPPADGCDLRGAFLERLTAYASEVAPEIADHVHAAFSQFADSPLVLFASCERQHPGTTGEFVGDLVGLLEHRAAARGMLEAAAAEAAAAESTGNTEEAAAADGTGALPVPQPPPQKLNTAPPCTGSVDPVSLASAMLGGDPALATLPGDDRDLLQAHFDTLTSFAAEHAPAMLATLGPAFVKHAAHPQALWAAIGKRFPGIADDYYADLLDAQDDRSRARERADIILTVLRLRKHAGGDSEEGLEEAPQTDASSAPSGDIEGRPATDGMAGGSAYRRSRTGTVGGDQPPSASISDGVPYLERPRSALQLHDVPPAEELVAQAAANATSGYPEGRPFSSSGRPRSAASRARPASAAAAPSEASQAESASRAGGPQEATQTPVVVTVVIRIDPAEARLTSGAASLLTADAALTASVPALVHALSALAEGGEARDLVERLRVSLHSDYHAPAASAAADAAAVSSAAPPPMRLTDTVPAVPSLREMASVLKTLAPHQLGLLHACATPNPVFVVAAGVLCVLLGAPTSWESARAVLGDPRLAHKLRLLSKAVLDDALVYTAGALPPTPVNAAALPIVASAEGPVAVTGTEHSMAMAIAVPTAAEVETDSTTADLTGVVRTPLSSVTSRDSRSTAASETEEHDAAQQTVADSAATDAAVADAATGLEAVLHGVDSPYARPATAGVLYAASGLDNGRPLTRAITPSTTASSGARGGTAASGGGRRPSSVEGAAGSPGLVLAGSESAPLTLTSHAVTIARRLLNRRPDIRGEARCMVATVRLPAHASDATDVSTAVHDAVAHGAVLEAELPLAALVAIVDWEVALVLRASKLQARHARLQQAAAASVAAATTGTIPSSE